MKKTADILARSGVAIMTNAPGSYSFPPVAILRAAGATVFSGSDNIRDSWWPYGDGDMLRRANLIGYRSGFFEDRELQMAFDIVTTGGATALGLRDYGIAVGCGRLRLAGGACARAVVAVPGGRSVYKPGVSSRNGTVLK